MIKQFEVVFGGKRKKRGFSVFLACVLLLGVLGFCIGCGGEEAITEEFSQLGLAVAFPADWEGKYWIGDETEDSLTVYHKEMYNQYPGLGRLFTVIRMPGELITEEGLGAGPPAFILARGNGWTYVVYETSDVNYPVGEEAQDETAAALVGEYQKMDGQLRQGGLSGHAIGSIRPQAANEGFQVAGTDFFTVEVPSDFTIAVSEDTAFRFELYRDGAAAGTFSMVPAGDETLGFGDIYEQVGTQGTVLDSGDLWTVLFFSEGNDREILLSVKKEMAEKDEMQAIADSLQFTGGIYNSIDFQSNALEYIRSGGERVFGQIKGFDYRENEEGEPVISGINFQRWEIVDMGENNLPEARKLGEKKVYPLNENLGDLVEVLPLLPPNFNVYGDYNIMHLQDFAEHFNEAQEGTEAVYADLFYNLIVVKGKVILIQGQYMP